MESEERRKRRRRGRRGGQPRTGGEAEARPEGAPADERPPEERGRRRDTRRSTRGEGPLPAGPPPGPSNPPGGGIRRAPQAAGERPRRAGEGAQRRGRGDEAARRPRGDEGARRGRGEEGARRGRADERGRDRGPRSFEPPVPQDETSIALGAAFREAQMAVRDARKTLEKRKAEFGDEPEWLVEQYEAAERRFAEAATAWHEHLQTTGRKVVRR